MSDILSYFKKVKAQKQINKLSKKYKNKRIVIYGAGEYFRILKENFDLSKLNIVGIADKKFETDKNTNFTEYIAITPDELKTFDCDIILVALYDDVTVYNYLEKELLVKKEKKVISIIEPTLLYIIKVFLEIK